MSNHKIFKETFEQIELRSSRIEELKNIQIVKSKYSTLRYVAAVAVTFVMVMLTCNGICYAMTGNNVVEKVINRYKELTEEEVRVNNDILSEQVVDSYLREDGLYHYEFTDGSSASIYIENPEHTSVFSLKQKIENGSSYSLICFVGELSDLNGRIILDIVGPIDITEDFADGVASGTFEYKWKTSSVEYQETFVYRVEGTLEKYTVDVWWEKEDE